jgi:hypothetical protein
MNMGFTVHTCFKDNTSSVVFLVDETPCTCTHHAEQDKENIPECCCKPDIQEEPDDQCCDTFLYVLDTAQSIGDYLEVEAPVAVWTIAPQTTSNHLHILYETTATAFHAATIVRGPDGGLASITPLRL